MNKSETGAEWPADRTLHDLIARIPAPIALLDDGGRALFVNDGFGRTYGAEVLDSAPLKDMIRKPVAG